MKLLEVKSLNTYYGESHILRNVDMNVSSGEMVCLIGRNGVGKTTLLKIAKKRRTTCRDVNICKTSLPCR